MTGPWTETALPTIVFHFSMENYFNADKFGLFYKLCQIGPCI